jgi:hypothetical protein
VKDSLISFFSDFPESEAREDFPDTSKNRVLEGERVPFL